MKKLLAILVLTGTSTLLQANYGAGCSSQGGQGYYQQGYQGQQSYQGQSYQGQPYSQGQNYQGQPYMQGQSYQGQQGQTNQDFYSNQQGYSQAPAPYTQQGYQGGQNFQGQPYGQGQNAQGQNGQGQNVNPDQKIAGQVQDSLRSAFSTKYNNVKVSVNNGVVTLQGTVPTQEDKTALEQKVRNMDGVRSVDNKVTVQAQK